MTDIINKIASYPVPLKPDNTWIKIQNKPVKDMRKLDLKLSASKRVVSDNGLTMFSVTGNQQGGKSSYGMCILSELFNHDEEEILNHIVLSAGDFAKKIMNALDGGYRERAIMWDDMSVSGSAASWMTDPKFVKALGGLGDTMAVATKCVLLTSPSGDTIKAFRNYSKYTVQIANGSGKFGRVARGYWMGTSPMGQVYCSSEFEDEYDVRIPFYQRYADKRKEISIKAAQEMMRLTQQQDNIPTEDSFIERAIITQWEKGIDNISKISRNIEDIMGIKVHRGKVTSILSNLGLRTID